MVQLLAPPDDWIDEYKHNNGRATKEACATAYLAQLAMVLSGVLAMCDPFAPGYRVCFAQYNLGLGPHKTFGVSMAGISRMHSLGTMIRTLDAKGLTGSYAETGVWRGGMSIYATAALQLSGGSHRPVYLCDSFQGLPKPRVGSWRARSDSVYHAQKLGVGGSGQVLQNFDAYGVNRSQVQVVEGFFVNTMPGLRKKLVERGERLAILRLDGDMYDSTADVLYHLYDRVQVGGYVIVDDFGWRSKLSFGARDAIMDFRQLHGIEDDAHAIRNIDFSGAWFYKAREVELRRDLYEASLASSAKVGRQSMLRKKGTVTVGREFEALMKKWRTQWTAEEEAAHVRAEALITVVHQAAATNDASERGNESAVPV